MSPHWDSHFHVDPILHPSWSQIGRLWKQTTTKNKANESAPCLEQWWKKKDCLSTHHTLVDFAKDFLILVDWSQRKGMKNLGSSISHCTTCANWVIWWVCCWKLCKKKCGTAICSLSVLQSFWHIEFGGKNWWNKKTNGFMSEANNSLHECFEWLQNLSSHDAKLGSIRLQTWIGEKGLNCRTSWK